MSEFIKCIGCGTTIHTTAPTCPKCGAPQKASAPVHASQPATPPVTKVRWYRQRWFALLCLISFTPIASLLAMTGDIYYTGKDGALRTLPKNSKLALILATFVWLMMFLGLSESSSLVAAVTLLVIAVLIVFKK